MSRKKTTVREKTIEKLPPEMIVPEVDYDVELDIPQKALFRIAEAAAQLRRSESTIRLWMAHHIIKYEHIVGERLVPRSEIIRLRIGGQIKAANKDAMK